MATILTPKRIILVSELFFPDETSTSYILTRIAEALLRQFEVLVVTGPKFYDGKSHSTANSTPVNPVNIFRVWLPKLSKNNLSGRLIRIFFLIAGIGWRLICISRPTDTVFAVTNPAPSLVLLALIRRFRRFRLVFLVHDVFPENAVAAGILRRDSFLFPLIKSVFDWSYNSADAIITIGRDMTEVVGDKVISGSQKIKLIQNWADHPLIERIPRDQSMIPSMNLLNRIVIQYAGNIGRAQGLIEFVNLVSAMRSDVVQFVFRGSGALSSELYKATQGNHNFSLEGCYPRSQQSLVLGSCDISLVVLRPDMYGLAVPSKTYNLLASGKPILFLGPKNSEIYLLVKENKLGWAFDWSESERLLEFLNQLSLQDFGTFGEYGNNSRRLVETAYTEALQLSKYSRFFEEMCLNPV
jgi:glycosyltransferase involved in cell wall biosynthesis